MVDGASTPRPRKKKGRDSAIEALHAFGQSFESMSNAYTASTQASMTSPQRKEVAIHAVEDDEGLSDTELVAVGKMFRDNTSMADMYMAFRRPSARTKYVQDMLHGED